MGDNKARLTNKSEADDGLAVSWALVVHVSRPDFVCFEKLLLRFLGDS